MQDEQRFTELMVRQEALKTMPFGDVWDEYCRSCNVPVGTDWFETVQKYERDVLSKAALEQTDKLFFIICDNKIAKNANVAAMEAAETASRGIDSAIRKGDIE